MWTATEMHYCISCLFFFFSKIIKFTELEFLDKHERTTSANFYLNLRVLYFSYPICGALNTWLWFQNARRYEDQQWTIQQEILHCEEKPPEPSIQKGSISFSSKLDKTSQTIICAIQYSLREDFFQTSGGKKVIWVICALIQWLWLKLHLLWSSRSWTPAVHPVSSDLLTVIREAFASLRAVKVSMESNATPCSLMIKDTQVRRHRATYNCHLKEWAISPPSLTTTLPRCQEVEHFDQNKEKRSGFEDVTGSLSSQKLLDKERAEIEVKVMFKHWWYFSILLIISVSPWDINHHVFFWCLRPVLTFSFDI